MLGLNDTFVTVTPEQMGELQRRMNALLAEFRAVGVGDARARRISVNTYARPMDLERAPVDDSRTMTGAVTAAAAAQRQLLVLSATRWLPVGLIIGLVDAAHAGARDERRRDRAHLRHARGSWCWPWSCRRVGWPMRSAAVPC